MISRDSVPLCKYGPPDNTECGSSYMATGTSFKQQCPSCEAMVPIRDPGLIGRKIDCPKCKYRFVVEEPEPEADEDDEDDKPSKKKGGDKNGKAPGKNGKDAKGG